MSRIAVCVSGRTRLAHRILKFIKDLSEDYVVMVFMHFWEETPSLQIQSWSKSWVNESDTNALKSMIGQSSRIRYIQERFSVMEPVFEKYRKTIDEKAFFNRWDVGLISMYYSVNQADTLRQEYEQAMKMKFDCVFRARFDSEPLKPFDLYQYDMSHLNVPNPEYDCGGINDRFAFGGSEVMIAYSSVYHHIKEYAEKTGYQPESILKLHLVRNSVKILRPDFPVLT